MRPILSGSFLLGLGSLLGLARDFLLARRLGATFLADVVFVSFLLPNFVENVLGVALRDALIPHLIATRGNMTASGYRRHLRTLTWATLGVSLLLAALVAWPERLPLHLVAPGWSAIQHDAALPSFLIGAAIVPLLVILFLQTAVLNVEGSFVLPMLRPALFNLLAILALALLPPDPKLVIAASGIGLAIMVVILGVAIWWRAPGGQSPAGVRQSGRSELAALLGPLLAAAVLQQLVILTERFFASFLVDGTIAALSFAFRLAAIPLTFFSLAVMAVLLPPFAKSQLEGDAVATGQLTLLSLRFVLLVLLPASAFLIAWPLDTVTLLLQPGNFGSNPGMVVGPMVAYAAGLPLFGLALLSTRLLIIRQQSAALLFAVAAGTLVTLALDLLLYRRFGATGLAAAFSVGAGVQAVLGWLPILRNQGLGGEMRRLATRYGAALAVMLAELAVLPHAAIPVMPVFAAALGFATFIAALWFLGERDLLRLLGRPSVAQEM
jgi:putative peptidoglycan lipid II flippase